ncbi:hypothetical protein JGH11_10260 [Dysgonomonas sp. Marseille-P4677]|uniref:hypothetical protein n=1 Tax=Dysgonomonas sp. Marseille-P4677 TaxID=2364790 RepID=UPI001913B3A2|nr:hypothetical protein [Dysgonomonas sp. Marseille-P4677]MBK5721253.1 hypothetical protein [Dysgonomonas sp. Marseille-P4677]
MKKYYILIFISALFYACNNAGGFMIWRGNNIEEQTRDEIRKLNGNLVHALNNKDVKGVRALLSKDLNKLLKNNLDSIVYGVGNSFNLDSYRVLDEYYIRNTTAGLQNTIPAAITDDMNYTISYKAMNKYAYISLLVPTSDTNELLIFAIYGKDDDEWKINILHFGQYSLSQKTAHDYYAEAKEFYDKSYLIDAANSISLGMKCLRPAKDFIIYEKDKEIKDFENKLTSEINNTYKMPVILDKIDTKPQVFNIYTQEIDEGFFPMVYYLSTINISDTAALKKENIKIRNIIGDYFTGIDKDKKYVFYKAFNEIPDGNKTLTTYGFVDNLENQ